MIIKEETLKFAKDHGFEIQTMKMGLNRIANIMVDDFRGLTKDKNLKRLIIINEIYLEICNSGELGLTENALNNKIKEEINKFLDGNSSVCLSSIDNKNINLDNELSLCDYLTNEMLDRNTYLALYNLVVNKDEKILNFSKKVKEPVLIKTELQQLLSQKIYQDSELEKLDLDFKIIINANHYTKKTDEVVSLLRKNGYSTLDIKEILKRFCCLEVIKEYDKREELRIKNKERSLYLKRKYDTKS